MASNNPILVLKGMLEGCIATWDLPQKIHADVFMHVRNLHGWMR